MPWSTRYSARAGASARGFRLRNSPTIWSSWPRSISPLRQFVNEGFAGSQIGVRHGSNPPSSRGRPTGRPRDEVLRTGHHAGWHKPGREGRTGNGKAPLAFVTARVARRMCVSN